MTVPADLLAILRCPESKQPVEYVPPGIDGPDEALYCAQSRLKYRIDDGIPVMLVEEAERLDPTRAERVAAALRARASIGPVP